MKFVWILLVLSQTIYAMDHDELIVLTIGFLDTIKQSEDPYVVLPCLDFDLTTKWDNAIASLSNLTQYSNKAEILVGFSDIIGPLIIEVVELSECPSESLKNLVLIIKKWGYNYKELVKKIYDMQKMVLNNLLDIKNSTSNNNYEMAGTEIGLLTNLIFSNP